MANPWFFRFRFFMADGIVVSRDYGWRTERNNQAINLIRAYIEWRPAARIWFYLLTPQRPSFLSGDLISRCVLVYLLVCRLLLCLVFLRGCVPALVCLALLLQNIAQASDPTCRVYLSLPYAEPDPRIHCVKVPHRTAEMRTPIVSTLCTFVLHSFEMIIIINFSPEMGQMCNWGNTQQSR